MALMLRAGPMKCAISVLAASALLAGCAQTAWYKPGADQADFQVDKATCISQAYAQVPYAPAVTMSPGYASCSGYGYSTQCYQIGGGPDAYDANAAGRQQVAAGCLYGKGWALMTRKQAEEMAGTSSTPHPVSSPAPQPALSPEQQRQDMLKAYSDSCAMGLEDACRTVQGLQKNGGQ
jgi:hypothetical protein